MRSAPLRLRLLNDYEVVVAGLHALLQPFTSRIQVVEAVVGSPSDRAVDLTLYDTFAATQSDQQDIDRVIADPHAGAVVIYSWNLQEELIRSAVEKGCRGYLGKMLPAAELVDALERVASGETVVSEGSPAISGTELAAPGTDWPGRPEGLSVREAEVVALITQGLTNDEIAARSYISVNSLKSYIRSAYRKMGVERRSQAVRWGIEHGMLPPADDRRVR